MIPAWKNCGSAASGFKFNSNLIFPSHLGLSPSSSWHCSGRTNPTLAPCSFSWDHSLQFLVVISYKNSEYSQLSSALTPHCCHQLLTWPKCCSESKGGCKNQFEMWILEVVCASQLPGTTQGEAGPHSWCWEQTREATNPSKWQQEIEAQLAPGRMKMLKFKL